ncbi:putative beta-hydroxyacyl-[acyl-carrier-protein] dehydratase subunit [Streptomyces lydicamycinicus]|uniref:Putative beta-hydroxyacyl-[acyl-carrier-protein] dehydratase subunit n=1 Tax=Streptomyces lydicamycinicus TaxID=1546107 RepID=A0A0P4R2N3_9ACTN|nr:putative beta-hydroxyacyl-[acyl-carrier-protein] dehydratase subunit [Streptomyces lydicamycinicus]
MKAGDELPALTIPLTRTLIVAGALASRDYQDVHHDAEAARAKGSPEIFMNILTSNGLVGRYITDHFGPRCTLRKVAIRLGAPNYPGDTMVLRGTVTEVTDGTAVVRVVGTNGIGHHVTGTVTVGIPEGVPEGGVPEGVPEGIPAGVPQGSPEGIPEGVPEGSPEGTPEGTPEVTA